MEGRAIRVRGNGVIGQDDEEFLRRWFRTIAADQEFEKKYLGFMGVPPQSEAPLGSNRRILGDFISNYDDRQRTIADYCMQLYHHTASGGRADFSAWFSRWGLGITLIAAGMIAVSTNPVFTGIVAVIGGAAIILGPSVYWKWKGKGT